MTEMQFLTYKTLPDARPGPVEGTAPKTIALPHPDQRSGLPLMTALSFRSSTREFTPSLLSMGTLGELLWAADGVNRPVNGGRTAPSPHAYNEIHIYVALPNGVYRYDAPNHQLLLKHAIDARNLTGYQDFVGKAPLDLVYVCGPNVQSAGDAPARA